jgi:hypothetical protein
MTNPPETNRSKSRDQASAFGKSGSETRNLDLALLSDDAVYSFRRDLSSEAVSTGPRPPRQTVSSHHDPHRPEGGQAAAFREVSMIMTSLRGATFAFFASLAIYGATTIPAGAFQMGKDMLTVALILTVNSLS